jgi:tetratricopeptide (TPR) repeat protein
MRASTLAMLAALTAVAPLALLGAPPSRLRAQTPAEVELCRQLESPTRWPDARGRAEAAARGSGESATFAQACLAMADDKFGDAERLFARLVNADGRSAVYHFYLGRAYGAQAQRANVFGKASLARKTKGEFDRAVQLDPEYLDAREGLMEYYAQAPGIMGGSMERAAEQVAEIRKRNPYRAGFLAAGLASRRKDWAAVTREYESLATQYPDSAAPYAGLTNFHGSAKRWDETFRAIDRWAAAQPSSMVAHYAAGRWAAESGQQLERGEQGLRRYIASYTPKPGEPPLANAHWRLGTILERRGQRDAARAEYQAAVGLDPKLKGAADALAKLK